VLADRVACSAASGTPRRDRLYLPRPRRRHPRRRDRAARAGTAGASRRRGGNRERWPCRPAGLTIARTVSRKQLERKKATFTNRQSA